MKTLEYAVELSKPPGLVWATMLDSERYNTWAQGFSQDSQYEGEWKQGAELFFFDPNMGGTKAIVETLIPDEYIRVRHFSVVGKDGAEDRESEAARKWIGTTEEYRFTAQGTGTTLQIRMDIDESFEDMLASGWSKSLALLKGLIDDVQ